MPDGVFANGPELISERVGLTNRIGAVLATLGVSDYNPLLRNRSRRLAELRTALGEPLPANAHAKIKRLLARLELVLTQVAELERERDAVVETEATDKTGKMIQQLTGLRGIGVQSATVLVRSLIRRGLEGPMSQHLNRPASTTVIGLPCGVTASRLRRCRRGRAADHRPRRRLQVIYRRPNPIDVEGRHAAGSFAQGGGLLPPVINAAYKACSAFTRVAACTLALPPIRDTLIEGFSHFVTSMTAPIASGWSGRRVGLAPTGKRRLVMAHTRKPTP